jgi:tetratricopeptide (TPR) repeat protein
VLTRTATLEGLTRLNRLAQWREEGQRWLEIKLSTDLGGLAEPAVRVAAETGDPIGTVLNRLLGLTPQDPELLERLLHLLEDDVYSRSIPLSELGLTVTEWAIASLRTASPEMSDELILTLGGLLRRLGDRRVLVGDLRGAVDVGRESVAILEDLCARAAEPPRGPLALALEALATRLGDLGELGEALGFATRAVASYRRLAEDSPGSHEADLARGLAHLGRTAHRSGIEHWPRALSAYRESIALHRAMDSEASKHSLAVCLVNLGTLLSDRGQVAAGLATTERGLELYRSLASDRPNTHEPTLALALVNRAKDLRRLGRLDEALAAAEEALAFDRRLADRRPEVFQGGHSRTLGMIATLHLEAGRPREALRWTDRAVATLQRPLERYPNLHRGLLADLYLTRAEALEEIGHTDASRAAYETGAELYLRQAEARREDPEIAADALNNQAKYLFEAGRIEAARPLLERAVVLYRQLVDVEPAAFAEYLALCLRNLGEMELLIGDEGAALERVGEAVALYRELHENASEAFAGLLASCLETQSRMLAALGRSEEAYAAADESVALRRALATEQPGSWEPDLSVSLTRRAERLLELDRVAEAVADAGRAVQLLIPRAAERRGLAPRLVKALDVYRLATDRSDRPEDDEAFYRAAYDAMAKLRSD